MKISAFVLMAGISCSILLLGVVSMAKEKFDRSLAARQRWYHRSR